MHYFLKHYDKCLELYTVARQLLNSRAYEGSKYKVHLRDHVEDELLMTEFLLWNKRGGAAEGSHHAALLSKAKSYYTNRHNCEGNGMPLYRI